MRTEHLPPTWGGLLPAMLASLTHAARQFRSGNARQRAQAAQIIDTLREEFSRMADAADRYNELVKRK